jgi:hypothetical protein
MSSTGVVSLPASRSSRKSKDISDGSRSRRRSRAIAIARRRGGSGASLKSSVTR